MNVFTSYSRAKISIDSDDGFNPLGNYRPQSFRIEETDSFKSEPPSSGETQKPQAGVYSYPGGIGNVMYNNCFGTGYKPGHLCSKVTVN